MQRRLNPYELLYYDGGVMQTAKTLFLILTIAALYYSSGTFGLLFAVEGTSATPLWPPAGIAVAAMCTFGSAIWPGILLGAFAVNCAHFVQGSALTISGSLGAATVIAFGNTIEAILCCYLCKRWIGANPLADVPGVFKFVPVTALACLVGSTIGTLTMIVVGLDHVGNMFTTLATWWLGDSLAIIVLAPLLMSWWPWRPLLRGAKLAELVGAFLLLVILCEVLFTSHIDLVIFNSQPFLVIPVLMWLAIRFGQRELTTGVALVCIFAIYATTKAQGPFVAETLTRSLLTERLFSAVVAVSMLVLSAAVTTSRRFQDNLSHVNEELEMGVAKRTEELEKKTRILEAINHQLRIEAQGRLSAEAQLRDLQQKRS